MENTADATWDIPPEVMARIRRVARLMTRQEMESPESLPVIPTTESGWYDPGLSPDMLERCL